MPCLQCRVCCFNNLRRMHGSRSFTQYVQHTRCLQRTSCSRNCSNRERTRHGLRRDEANGAEIEPEAVLMYRGAVTAAARLARSESRQHCQHPLGECSCGECERLWVHSRTDLCRCERVRVRNRMPERQLRSRVRCHPVLPSLSAPELRSRRPALMDRSGNSPAPVRPNALVTV